MLLLEHSNRILLDTLGETIRNAEERGTAMLDTRLCDFDEVSYYVHSAKGSTDLFISCDMPCFREIKDNGGQEALEKHFGQFLTDAEQGFDFTLKIDLAALPDDRDQLVADIGNLKAIVMGGVFMKALVNLENGASGDPVKFTQRPDTTVFIVPKDDRVTIVYKLDFPSRVDNAVAKVFFQEFVECRRHVRNAPPCMYSLNPPAELASWGITDPDPSELALGYLSVVILPKKGASNEQKTSWCNNLCGLRNYLQYHIKCSKANFHQRMRKRVASLLQVLNRAKTDQEKVKKTMSGKTFKQG